MADIKSGRGRLKKLPTKPKMQKRKSLKNPLNKKKKRTASAPSKKKKSFTPKKSFNKTKKKTPNANKRATIKCNHTKSWNYTIETNSCYCKEGMDLHGVMCCKCKTAFGIGKQTPPSMMQPIFVCYNRTTTGCNHSFCAVCYYLMINKDNENNNSKRRTRRNINTSK